MSTRRLTNVLFLATAFCVTFEKVHWQVAGNVSLADLLTILFLAAFAGERLARGDGSVPHVAVAVLLFLVSFVLVYGVRSEEHTSELQSQ